MEFLIVWITLKMLMEPTRHVTSVKMEDSLRMEVVRRTKELIAEYSLQRQFVRNVTVDSLCS